MVTKICGLDQFLDGARSLGMRTELVRPESVSPGQEWWPYPFDAWPLLSLVLLEEDLRPVEIPVVYARSAEDVVSLVGLARETGVCLVPRGGGSGVLGATYRGGCRVILDIQGLSWVRVDPEDRIVHVGPGALMSRVEEEASQYGLTTGFLPQSVRVASVGGLISTFGAGYLQPGIGNVEDVLVYVDFVTGSGHRVRLGSPRRPRGPLLGAELLPLGAEGGLGIIVGAGLRLREKPRYEASATLRFESIRDALRFSRDLVQWNQPAVLRVLDSRESMLYGRSGVHAIVSYHDNDYRVLGPLIEKAVRIGWRHGGGRVDDLYGIWKEQRYNYGLMILSLAESGLWFDTIDLQATWSVLPKLHEELAKELSGLKGVAMSFSHISHFTPNGGSLYLTVVTEQDPRVLARVWRTVMGTTLRVGASLTHHHGVGLQKLPWITHELGVSTLRFLCEIRETLDPDNVLCSGGVWRLCRRKLRP